MKTDRRRNLPTAKDLGVVATSREETDRAGVTSHLIISISSPHAPVAAIHPYAPLHLRCLHTGEKKSRQQFRPTLGLDDFLMANKPG